jgi:hypothetical protein
MSEYPTEKELDIIRQFPIDKVGSMALAQLVVELWHWEDYAKLNGRRLELHTGGWSGNEDIISALQDNFLFWNLCWEKTTRGGHYHFKIKELIK